jgi:hypothetical protein
MREPGFYWVRRNDNWTIYEWDDEDNNFVKGDFYYHDDEFDEIDERRIVRDEQCKDNSLKDAKLLLINEDLLQEIWLKSYLKKWYPDNFK